MVLKKYQVPGTVPSGKPPKSEPYRTVPYHAVEKRHKCVPWESNPQPFALLTQCSTTEPHRKTKENDRLDQGEEKLGRGKGPVGPGLSGLVQLPNQTSRDYSRQPGLLRGIFVLFLHLQRKRAKKITLDPSHPAHSLFELLHSSQ